MAQAKIEDPKFDSSDVDAIAAHILDIAYQRQGNSLALLELLRMLERVHREISDGLFQAALPSNRQDLYGLLRDIENHGGWPYIYSRKLRVTLSELTNLLLQETGNNEIENDPSSGF